MKYVFTYKDGRNYDDNFSSGMVVNAKKNNLGEIVLELFSSLKGRICLTLNQDEANAIGHALLSSSSSNFTSTSKQKTS